jgi:hypothetical protein
MAYIEAVDEDLLGWEDSAWHHGLWQDSLRSCLVQLVCTHFVEEQEAHILAEAGADAADAADAAEAGYTRYTAVG